MLGNIIVGDYIIAETEAVYKTYNFILYVTYLTDAICTTNVISRTINAKYERTISFNKDYVLRNFRLALLKDFAKKLPDSQVLDDYDYIYSIRRHNADNISVYLLDASKNTSRFVFNLKNMSKIHVAINKAYGIMDVPKRFM